MLRKGNKEEGPASPLSASVSLVVASDSGSNNMQYSIWSFCLAGWLAVHSDTWELGGSIVGKCNQQRSMWRVGGKCLPSINIAVRLSLHLQGVEACFPRAVFMAVVSYTQWLITAHQRTHTWLFTWACEGWIVLEKEGSWGGIDGLQPALGPGHPPCNLRE